jgi:acetate kinase
METIITFNAGSTSLKYQIFDLKTLKVLDKNEYDIEEQGKERKILQESLFEKILTTAKKLGEVKMIGHRVVHGGKYFTKPTIITKDNIKELEKNSVLAPLHNPHNLLFIKLALKKEKNIKNLAVFDTGFFSTLPPENKILPIPYKYYDQGIYKYGFHGISHEYVANASAKKLNKKLSSLNLIICHLGGGSSVCAIKKGKAFDCSFSFSPTSGLPMSTRSGDIDPGVIFHILKNEKLTLNQAIDLFNKESGIKGISNKKSSKELETGYLNKNEIDVTCFKLINNAVKKYIGAFYATLGKVDAIVFTGGIGYHGKIVRNDILKNLPFKKDLKVVIIKTNEELLIASYCKKNLK